VACPAVQNSSALSHTGHVFQKKKVIELKVCFDFLYKYCLEKFSFKEELSKI